MKIFFPTASRGVLALTAILSGCATSTPVHLEDGEPAILIECGILGQWAPCYDQAADECPKGYETLKEDNRYPQPYAHDPLRY